MKGGELFVPRIPSYRITDLAHVISPDRNIQIVGIRSGEKLHEEMISLDEGRRTYQLGSNFVILPEKAEIKGKLKKVENGFSYSSKSNPIFLTKKQLEEEVALIKKKLFS